MSLSFDLDAVTVTEFGVGRRDCDEQRFLAVPADEEVQAILVQMAADTWKSMSASAAAQDGSIPGYEPSEKHGGTQYLVVPADDLWDREIRELHNAANLPLDSNGLKEPERIFCYFARLTDGLGRRLTALRRATQFKWVVKSRLIRLGTDAVKVVENTVFKLDADFDLLIDEQNTHVWRPSGFESLAELTQALLNAVPSSISTIGEALPFLDLTGVESYASSRPRAARYLASIGSRQQLAGVTPDLLMDLCERTGVNVNKVDGSVHVGEGSEMGFLEVLDRRRYELSLVPDAPERFRAMSREKIGR